MSYFETLISLLDSEREYDKLQHETVLLKSSLSERKAKGLTWFPIQITNSELGRGDYLTISLNKTGNLEDAHKFRFGMPVSLFSNHNADDDRIAGTIVFVGRDSMKISFRTDELPDWSRKGKLGVDLLFDENAYREMDNALTQADTIAKDLNQGLFIRQLIGIASIRDTGEMPGFEDPMLNHSQNQAIRHILAETPLMLLHGPPGTGKTTTLIKAICALLKRRNQQLLVVAPSNTAVDILTEKLDTEGIYVLRIGNPVRVSDHLQALTLDAKMAEHSAYREAKVLEKQARAYIDMANKYKRNFGRAEREQRKALLQEAHKIRKDIDRIQDYIMTDILNKAQVITATLVGANHPNIRNRCYETVIIDEAAQALEPACWIPILKGNSLILAGDHCQLPPTVKHSSDSSNGLYHTLFEKLVHLYPQRVFLLDTQYRMNSQIMKYPSYQMYQDRLQAAPVISQWTLREDSAPVVFIDTAGAGFEEEQVDNSICNREEAFFLLKHLRSMAQQLELDYVPDEFPSIGIITPYRQQATLIKHMLLQDEILHKLTKAMQINTIDGFQGQEKDIIYISLVRCNSSQAIGFLSDVRRMNVALTRAKKKMVVIGDSGTIGHHPFYKGFLAYVESIDSYKSIWEWGNW